MTVDEVANNTKKQERSRRRRNRQQTVATTAQNNRSETARKDRPTPTRRENNKRSNVVTRFFRGIVDYFNSTRAELQKVTWPSRQDSIRLSGIVIGVTIVSSLSLGLLDYLYGEFFRLGISNPILFVIGAGIVIVLVGGFALTQRRNSSL